MEVLEVVGVEVGFAEHGLCVPEGMGVGDGLVLVGVLVGDGGEGCFGVGSGDGNVLLFEGLDDGCDLILFRFGGFPLFRKIVVAHYVGIDVFL